MKNTELLSLRRSSHLSISPDGLHCAFLAHTPLQNENEYTGRVYISDFSLSSPLGVSGVADFVWMDGNNLVISRRENNGTAFFILSVSDGSEVPFAYVDFEASTEGFVGDRLLISARRPITVEKSQENGNWTVLDELPIWKDGLGFSPKIRRELFLCGGNNQLTCVSPKGMDVRLVSTCGDFFVYAGCTPDTFCNKSNEIRYWDGSDHPLYKGDLAIEQLSMSEGKVYFASVALDAEAGTSPVIMEIPVSGSSPAVLCKSDLAIGNYIVSDAGSNGKVFAADGNSLYFIATEKGASQIYKISEAHLPERLTSVFGSVDQLDVHAGRIVFAGLRGFNRHEVYCLSDGEHKISCLHDEVLTTCRPMTSINCPGIQGWALREEAENRSHPAVVFIHDGPQQSFGEVYHFGMQLLAQHGYVVLFANLPGSIGYGSDFASLGGQWGDKDCDALCCFLDAALAACPEIDPSRVAVIGTGYGAYLAAVSVGKTSRFAAAVYDGVISNCVSMEATSDHGLAFAAKQMKASGYTQPEDLWRRSPLSRISSMKAPSLILHGELDRSCHLSQGQMLFTALKVHGVPAKMCIFPGQSHNFSSIGSPLSRDRYYDEILKWLSMWLNKEKT